MRESSHHYQVRQVKVPSYLKPSVQFLIEHFILKNNVDNLFEPIISRQRAQVALQRGEFIRQISAGAVDPAPSRARRIDRLSITCGGRRA